jgi:hypothetical protein
VLHFAFGMQYLPVRVCTQLAAWVLSCPSYWGLPLCISVDTPGSSPHPLHYIVFPLPPLILVPVTVHCPCDPTIPCSVVCEQSLRKELLLDIPVAYLVIVECCVLWGTSPWTLLERQTWLVMEATIPLYMQKTTRRKYNLVLECGQSSFVRNLTVTTPSLVDADSMFIYFSLSSGQTVGF